MKIVYLGSGRFGIECLNALRRSEHGLELIVTQPPSPAGRGRRPSPTPVARWAVDNSIPFIEAEDVNRPQVIEQVAECRPDLILVIAFGQKVPGRLSSLPSKGALNVHASLLPKYRGAAPINWAIINGETRTGISIITLADRIDAGQILSQADTEIAPDETAGQLHDRLAKIAAPLLLETLAKIENATAVYAEQDHESATRAPKLKKADGFLNFNEPADSIRRKVLGLWPWPGASAMYVSKESGRAERVTIARADIVWMEDSQGLAPGQIDENLNVVCGADRLQIMQIKPEGSRLMPFDAFVNGRHTRPGDRFDAIMEPRS